MGTPAYMAPEQARGERGDARGDLFSLGRVLYRLCTGILPFAGDATMSQLTALAQDHPRPVRDLNPDVPPDLSDLVMRLLEKDTGKRPQTAREVVRALQAIASPGRAAGPVPAVGVQPAGTSPAARPEGPPAAPASGGRRRRPWVLAAVAAGFLATAAAATVIIIPYKDKDGNPREIKVELPKDAHDASVTVNADDAAKPPPTQPSAGVDDAWVKQVAALSGAKQVDAVAAKMKERNPGLDGKLGPVDFGGDGAVITLTFTADWVTDLSPLKALTRLRSLGCLGSGGVIAPLADLSPLKDMGLSALNCSGTHVSDLSPLQGRKLGFLICNYTPVSDLSPLKGMPLNSLSIGSTQVADLSPLEGIKLTELYCGGTNVTDLSPLKGMPLTELHCNGTKVSDLSPLKGMPLKALMIDFDPKRDTDVLRSIKTLETINGRPAAEFWKDVDAKKP